VSARGQEEYQQKMVEMSKENLKGQNPGEKRYGFHNFGKSYQRGTIVEAPDENEF
jgi:hypothetical protein